MRFLASVVLGAMAMAPMAQADCTPETTLALEKLVSGHVAVPLTINGKSFRFLLDTGASNSLLTERAVNLAGLVPTPLDHSAKALSGDAIREKVHIDRVGLGGHDEGAGDFAVLPNASPLMDGILGTDLLGRYDIELDFAGGVLRLYPLGTCHPDWAAATLPYTEEQGHSVVALALDGKALAAWLDTGAQQTLISAETAAALFVLDPAKITAAKPPRQKYRFGNLVLAGLDHAAPQLVLAPDASLNFKGQAHMLLGIDILHQHRLFIAWGAKTIFLGAKQ